MSVFISGKLVIQISDELRADNQIFRKNINEKMPINDVAYGALNCNFVVQYNVLIKPNVFSSF